MNVTKKKKLSLAAVSVGVLGLSFAVLFASGGFDALASNSSLASKETDRYQLTLNSSNKVTSAGDHVQKTALGNDVTFSYNSVASSTSGHVDLNSGGYLVNKSQITSISAITANFSGVGTLKASIAYTSDNFAEPFELVSGSKVELGSNPYYVKLQAVGGAVSVSTVNIQFTCSANPDAESHDTSGTYDITFAATGSDSSSDISSTSAAIMEQVSNGSEFISSFSDGSKIYAGSSGLKFGSSKAAGNLTINFNSTNVSNAISTVDVSTAQYSTDTGNFKVYVNDSTSYTSITPSDGGSVTVEGALTSLTFETTTKRAYLCGLTLNYGGTTQPGTPVNPSAYETGFTASDSRRNDYTTNSIFANENGLSVVSNKSDGTSSNLSSSEYSYVIKDSNNNTIDPTQKFPASGVYTLYVSYGNYIPQEITLNVGEYVYMTDVAASMTTTTFNTADILSSKLAGNLTANIEYSNGTISSSISYSDFAENEIGIKLLTPKGIAYNIDTPFGTAGTWTLKVYDLDNEAMYYNISLTVNAIPVQTITLSESSYSLVEEGTLQLTATVNPTNATNSVVDWSSNNESVATVDDNGLVTAVSVGSATITATAADGSNVYGSCALTVTAKPVSVSDTLTRETTGISNGTTSYSTWSGKTGTSGAVYAGQSAGDKDSIQIRSKNSNSGIITTTSGGKISKVSVEFQSETASGRVLNIYGKSTAYSSASDLYGSNSGTLIGTIVNGTSTELSISDEYTYVGVRSNDGAIYLTNITFTWGGSAAATPVYPTSISLSGTSSISIGSTSQLDVTYTPSDTTVKNVSFTSSNTSIATVSSSGLVTGVAAGSATITATAEKESGTTTATINITVTEISVTSISLDSNTATVKAGKTVTLVATVYPTNATNKTVSWSSSNSAVATVTSAGVVTGVSAGEATITASCGGKTATCVVTVTSAATAGEETFSISYTDLPTSYQTGTTVYTASSGIKFQAYNCANYSSKMQFKASSGYLQSTEELTLQSITINDRESNELTVYGSNTSGSFETEITGTNDVYDLTGYSYFKVARTASGAAYCSSITVLTGTPTPTDPTSIVLSPTSADVGVGGTKQLSVSYVPSNANQNKAVTWTSSNTNVATVSSEGLVSVKSTATAGQTAIITAKLTNIPSITATCTITVTAQTKDDHTVLIYMCGADLESGYASSNQGLATGDITEILSVSGQPDDINIVIETGGASSWSSTYGISSSKLERWHVENKSLVKDASLTYASMGLTSTLQSFIEYGLTNYPAERTGLIFWNHGGAMRGVCYDEKKSDDSLLANEVTSAVSGALSNCGMSGQKLEWVGYDACLMQVQDIASVNSDYFNYMVASEESEAGEGWDYDTWVDDLYAHKTSPTIFKAIVDGFIKSNGGTSSSSNDQTLSYLNLSYMDAYVTAWNNMATQLGTKLTSSNKSSFNTLVKSAKYYADSDYTYYGIFDAKDFVNKLAANDTFNPGSTYTNAVLTAFSNLVEYSSCGKGAGNSYGLCMFWSCSSNCAKSTYYTAAMTKFTAWRTLVTTYGS